MYKRKRTKYTIEHVCRKEGKSWKVDVRTKEVKAGCHLIKKKLNSWPGPLLQQITKAHRAKFSLFFFLSLSLECYSSGIVTIEMGFHAIIFPPFPFLCEEKSRSANCPSVGKDWCGTSGRPSQVVWYRLRK